MKSDILIFLIICLFYQIIQCPSHHQLQEKLDSYKNYESAYGCELWVYQGYRNPRIFVILAMVVQLQLLQQYLSIINRINQKHLPRTKLYNSIQRMLNFCALLPYTLLSFCFIFVVSIQFRSAGRWLLLLSKYYSWLC